MHRAIAFGSAGSSYFGISEYPQTKRGGKDAGRGSVGKINFSIKNQSYIFTIGFLRVSAYST